MHFFFGPTPARTCIQEICYALTNEPMNRIRPLLTNWRLTQGHLEGVVSVHPDYADGTVIETSNVLSFDGTRVRTRNCEYGLGEPHPVYIELLVSMRITPQIALHVVTTHNSIRVRAGGTD